MVAIEAEFLFHLFQHTPAGRQSLVDVIGIIGNQLRALGHNAIHDPLNDDAYPRGWFPASRGFNVIVEGFTPHTIAEIAAAHAEGARFICLATEEPTPKGFNHGTSKEMVARQEIFPEAMKYFEGIIHLVPGKRITDWYVQFAPTAQAELGYPGFAFPQMV